MKSQCI